MPRDAVSTIYVRVWHRIELYRIQDKSKCYTIDNSVMQPRTWDEHEIWSRRSFAKLDHLLRLK